MVYVYTRKQQNKRNLQNLEVNIIQTETIVYVYKWLVAYTWLYTNKYSD